MRRRPSALIVLGFLSAIALAGCTELDLALGKIPWFSDMRDAVSYGPHEMPRTSPEGTVPSRSPMGEVPAPFGPTAAGLDSAAMLTNPLPPTEAVLARGREVYDIQCAVCHGYEGEGNGPVVGPGRFPFAPPVATGEAVGRNDGYLYGVVRVGRGLMPAYAERISHEDRWAVVHYMRELQGELVVDPLGPAPEPQIPLEEPTPPPPAADVDDPEDDAETPPIDDPVDDGGDALTPGTR